MSEFFIFLMNIISFPDTGTQIEIDMYHVHVGRVHSLPFNPTDSDRTAHRKRNIPPSTEIARSAEARFGALKAARRGLMGKPWGYSIT